MPDPLGHVELAVVGFCVVDQQIPRAVTVPHPSEVTFPPELAELQVIELGAVVANVGTTTANVVNDVCAP
jgi:hypothetical protein